MPIILKFLTDFKEEEVPNLTVCFFEFESKKKTRLV